MERIITKQTSARRVTTAGLGVLLVLAASACTGGSQTGAAGSAGSPSPSTLPTSVLPAACTKAEGTLGLMTQGLTLGPNSVENAGSVSCLWVNSAGQIALGLSVTQTSPSVLENAAMSGDDPGPNPGVSGEHYVVTGAPGDTFAEVGNMSLYMPKHTLSLSMVPGASAATVGDTPTLDMALSLGEAAKELGVAS